VSLRESSRYSWKYNVVKSIKPEKPIKLKGCVVAGRTMSERSFPDGDFGMTHSDET
jgi:hypothetical protein